MWCISSRICRQAGDAQYARGGAARDSVIRQFYVGVTRARNALHLPARNRHGGHDMSSVPRPVDLTQVPAVPWAWVDEHVYAAIRGCSVKVLQNERRLNIGCPFRRINGTTIRYKLGDITAFLESQPGGGGAAKPSNQPARGWPAAEIFDLTVPQR
jgi:hypothetical protein